MNVGAKSGLAQMQELLIEAEVGIVRRGRERRFRFTAIARKQIFHDRDGLDHRCVAVLQRRNEAAGIDGEKFRVLLYTRQQIDRAQFVRKAHLFQLQITRKPRPSPQTVIML